MALFFGAVPMEAAVSKVLPPKFLSSAAISLRLFRLLALQGYLGFPESPNQDSQLVQRSGIDFSSSSESSVWLAEQDTISPTLQTKGTFYIHTQAQSILVLICSYFVFVLTEVI